MKENIFYETAYNLIHKEIEPFESLCNELDENREEKEKRTVEYKCAKYRLSALHRISNMLFHGKNVIECGCTHIDIETSLNAHSEYLTLYTDAHEDEKKEYKLYYGIKAYTEDKIEELNEKLKKADDWEGVEIKEKLEGYRFALSALDKGWERKTNEYPIQVSNGKIIGDSAFFLIANDLLGKECKRLCDFTDFLDKTPLQKKEKIAEYKCAKYRYASVSLIHSTVHNNNRCRKLHNIEYSHYLLQPFDEIFKECGEYLALYESAAPNEKPDFSLYYAMLEFTERELAKLKVKRQNATDWERVELTERIGGFEFAIECLNQAWQNRGGESL